MRWASFTDSELIESVLAPNAAEAPTPPLDLAAALRLSWRLFEALIAVLYEREADRVILTLVSNDHGSDVVVLGWGAAKENVLIQCKSTSLDELNSEAAVREVEGSRPFYENILGVPFTKRCLHTNARRIGDRTRNAARICGVTVNDREWLSTKLAHANISLTTLLAKEASRKSV